MLIWLEANGWIFLRYETEHSSQQSDVDTVCRTQLPWGDWRYDHALHAHMVKTCWVKVVEESLRERGIAYRVRGENETTS